MSRKLTMISIRKWIKSTEIYLELVNMLKQNFKIEFDKESIIFGKEVLQHTIFQTRKNWSNIRNVFQRSRLMRIAKIKIVLITIGNVR